MEIFMPKFSTKFFKRYTLESDRICTGYKSTWFASHSFRYDLTYCNLFGDFDQKPFDDRWEKSKMMILKWNHIYLSFQSEERE